MLGSIDFSKRLFQTQRGQAVQTMPAVAITDSVDGSVVIAVGMPLEDLDGNPVPEFDGDGNELGDLGNQTEAATVGNMSEGDPVVFGNGFATGTPGGGDKAESGATDYIKDVESGVLFTYPGSLSSIFLGGIDIKLVSNETMSPIASMSEQGFRLYDSDGEETTYLDADGVHSRTGQVRFANGVDVWPSDGEKFNVNGDSGFGGAVSMPLKIQAGNVSPETVAAGGVREIPVTFDTPFSSAPIVIASLESAQTQFIGNCSAYVHNRTSTGFTLRIANNYTNTRNLGAQWVAVAP